MHAAPVGRACEVESIESTRVNYRYVEHPTFPAQWFSAYLALSPVSGLFSHRRRRIRRVGPLGPTSPSPPLDPSVGGSGPHDFAVRPGALVSRAKRPSHPAPNVVTIGRSAPLRVRDAGDKHDFRKNGSVILAWRGWLAYLIELSCKNNFCARGRRARRHARRKSSFFCRRAKSVVVGIAGADESIAVKRVRRFWRGGAYTVFDSASGAASCSLTDAITSAEGIRLAGSVRRRRAPASLLTAAIEWPQSEPGRRVARW